MTDRAASVYRVKCRPNGLSYARLATITEWYVTEGKDELT